MSEPEQPSANGEWPVEPGPFAIRYPIGLLHEIDFNVKDAARRISHGGMETGGFLFGRTSVTGQRDTVQIEAFRAIDCEHAFGPSFVLSERDITKMREQLVEAGSDPDLETMRLLGWYIGHARNPLRLSDHEASLFERLFPRPGQLTLLVKPERFAPSNLAFIVRGQDRKVDRDGTKLAFPLPPLSKAAPPPPVEDKPEGVSVPADTVTEAPEPFEIGAPVLQAHEQQPKLASQMENLEVLEVAPSPAVMAKTDEPAQSNRVVLEPAETKPVAEKSIPEANPVTAEPAAVSFAAPTSSPVSPELPERELAANDHFLALEDLRARRLQRLERSERVEHQGGLEELAPLAPTYAFMQYKPPLQIWRPLALLAVVMVLCGGAFGFYHQYFAPSVPLQVDERTDKLMVSWPADATRDAGDASIEVNGDVPLQLSPEEKILGRAEIAPTGDDVQVQLVVHHWFGDAKGRVRFLRPVMTALP